MGWRAGSAVRTQSGRVDVRGNPTAAWNVTTGSSLIDVVAGAGGALHARRHEPSSSVHLTGIAVEGFTAKERVSGTVGGGGPIVRLASRSGQIHIGH